MSMASFVSSASDEQRPPRRHAHARSRTGNDKRDQTADGIFTQLPILCISASCTAVNGLRRQSEVRARENVAVNSAKQARERLLHRTDLAGPEAHATLPMSSAMCHDAPHDVPSILQVNAHDAPHNSLNTSQRA